jgi:hypothetical protein
MKTGQFQTYMIALLLIFAICGTSAAVSWDISDYYHVHTLSIEQHDSHSIDMDDAKNKQLVLSTTITVSFDYPLPEPMASVLSPTDTQPLYYQSNITQSFPTRASPA